MEIAFIYGPWQWYNPKFIFILIYYYVPTFEVFIGLVRRSIDFCPSSTTIQEKLAFKSIDLTFTSYIRKKTKKSRWIFFLHFYIYWNWNSVWRWKYKHMKLNYLFFNISESLTTLKVLTFLVTNENLRGLLTLIKTWKPLNLVRVSRLWCQQ